MWGAGWQGRASEALNQMLEVKLGHRSINVSNQLNHSLHVCTTQHQLFYFNP